MSYSYKELQDKARTTEGRDEMEYKIRQMQSALKCANISLEEAKHYFEEKYPEKGDLQYFVGKKPMRTALMFLYSMMYDQHDHPEKLPKNKVFLFYDYHNGDFLNALYGNSESDDESDDENKYNYEYVDTDDNPVWIRLERFADLNTPDIREYNARRKGLVSKRLKKRSIEERRNSFYNFRKSMAPFFKMYNGSMMDKSQWRIGYPKGLVENGHVYVPFARRVMGKENYTVIKLDHKAFDKFLTRFPRHSMEYVWYLGYYASCIEYVDNKKATWVYDAIREGSMSERFTIINDDGESYGYHTVHFDNEEVRIVHSDEHNQQNFKLGNLQDIPFFKSKNGDNTRRRRSKCLLAMEWTSMVLQNRGQPITSFKKHVDFYAKFDWVHKAFTTIKQEWVKKAYDVPNGCMYKKGLSSFEHVAKKQRI